MGPILKSGIPAGVLLTMLAVTTTAFGWAETPEQMFHRAYFLEHDAGDVEGAAELYGAVARAAGASEELRARASSRREGCMEELATADFARLMTPNTLLYIELNRPGAQVARLVEQLGLLRTEGDVFSGQKLGISEALFKELLGVRGAAIGIQGVDMSQGKPTGVLVFHPGDVNVLRGLIETALPAGGKAVDAIDGFPTYDIEGEVFITLTRRLAIVSQQRGPIRGVVRRLTGQESRSVLDNEIYAKALADRDRPLIYFCANFKPLLRMVNAFAGQLPPEARAIQAVLDPESFDSLSGSFGVSDHGVHLNVGLRLDDNHRNLVFNLLRTPPVDRRLLRMVPAGALAFSSMSLNEAGARPVSTTDDDRLPPISLLDLGREIFANIIGISTFVVPTEGETIAGEPLPAAPALILSVHDADKSEALWTQCLGLSGLATPQASMAGSPVKIEGVDAKRYDFPEDVSIYFVRSGQNILITPSKKAAARAIATRNGGKSVLDDPAFARCLKTFDQSTTGVSAVHPGRCLEVALAFMSSRERAEVEPFMPRLQKTVIAAGVRHSPSSYHLHLMVNGIPRVGPVISELIAREMNHPHRHDRPKAESPAF